jgi:hypothetical protein
MLLVLAALACHKPAPPQALDASSAASVEAAALAAAALEAPVPEAPISELVEGGQCPWTWEDSVISDGGERASADSVRVIDTDGDLAPDLLADLGGCGSWGDCLFAVLQSCGDGSYTALWGPEYAQHILVEGQAPLQITVGGRSAQPGCDVPSEQLLGWVDGQWQDQGTCYGLGPWEPEECGEMPQPACPAQDATEPAELFEQEGFTACDAKQLAEFWGNPTAAQTMNDKLSAGGKDTLKSELQLAYDNGAEVQCAWHETGFDAVQISQASKVWGLTPDVAAQRVAKLASTGQYAQVRQALP